MIGRPPKCRRVGCRPVTGLFKPHRVPSGLLEEEVLAPDEVEALRLADLEGLYHVNAAVQMGISRQTFGTIIEQARRKVASALIGGKALRLAGVVLPTGDVELSRPGRVKTNPGATICATGLVSASAFVDPDPA